MRITRKAEGTPELDGPGEPPGGSLRLPARLSWRALVLPLLLPVVLAVLLVGVVATSVVLLLDRHEAPRVVTLLEPADVARSGVVGGRDTPAGQALVRARLAATTYFTVDYRRIQADLDRMRHLGTPDFVAGYDADTTALAARVSKQRIVLSAHVPRDGVATEYLTADLAQVVVAVDVTTRRAAGGAGSGAGSRTTTPYRTRITLERVGGSWLVAAVDEVG